TLVLPPELQSWFVKRVLQDHISAAHPAAPLVVAPLLAAVGVLHAEPRMAVLPDDPRLRGYECVSPERLGTIEERPTEGPDGEPGFAGAAELASTKKLFERLGGDPDHRVDSRAFLTARLLDLFIGDWDRHHDQWRWARFDEGGRHSWRPIPRDRDWAFARMDGLLVGLAGFYQPQLIGFGDQYPNLFRLTWSGRVLDRRLLVDLERPVWDSLAAVIQGRLTDSVIDAAVRRLPPEYFDKNGADLARALKMRRDQLPEAAAQFYALLAAEVDVHATDADDRAEVERLAGGRTALRLTAHGFTYYHRTFEARATREIRLYLHGGDDRLVVRGAGSGPMLRAIGGGGDDELVDSAWAGKTRLYDDRGENRFVRGPGTAVDRRHYDAPPPDTATLARPRDWGSRTAPVTWVSFGPDIGLFAGGGAVYTGYGFRHSPYRSRVVLRAGYATTAASYRAEFTGEFRGLVAPAVAWLHLRASGIDVLRFHGFGNETVAPGGEPGDSFEVRQQQFRVEPSLAFPLSPATELSFGPVFKFAQTDPEPGSFLSSTGPYYGTGSFGQVGTQAGLRLDTRDRLAAAGRGVSLSATGRYYAKALDVTAAFGSVRGEAAGYLSAGDPAVATLALRVGGAKV
ncbi:MAG: hypothetical protein ACRENJ_11455, partial [Candidatus Eiseniibacteriota bacterium]